MKEEDDELDEMPARPRHMITAADRELLELAARALGAVRVEDVEGEAWINLHFSDNTIVHGWNPLLFHGDAFELAADLGLQVYPVARTRYGEVCSAAADVSGRRLSEITKGAGVRADTARAVVQAAAEIGKALC